MEQIVDVPIPQVVEELVEVFKVSPQDKIEQHSVEQTIETPAFSLAEKIVEMLVTQTQEKTRQVANTHVQRVVNTVELEIPHFGAETDEDQFAKVKGLITCSINRSQAEAPSDASHTSYRDEGTSKATVKKEDFEADDAKHSSKLEAAIDRNISTLQSVLGVFSERQLQMDTTRADERYQDWEVPMIQTVQKTVDVPQLQFLNKVDDTPVALQRQIPMVQAVQKTMKISQLQCVDKVVDDPVEHVVHVPQLQVVEKIVEIPEI